MKRRREKEQDKGNAEWLNVQYVGKREETETGTPMLARAETHYCGCCQHRCWTEGELSISVRACIRTWQCAWSCLTVIWGLFSDDSCWHNEPFSLFIYTVQSVSSISSLFLPILLSFPQILSSPFLLFTPFSIFHSVARCTPVVICVWVWATNGCCSLFGSSVSYLERRLPIISFLW